MHFTRKLLAGAMAIALALPFGAAAAGAEQSATYDVDAPVKVTINGAEAGEYQWEYIPETPDDPETDYFDESAPAYYILRNVKYLADAPVYHYGRDENLVQAMNIMIPAAYFDSEDGVINGYTLATAPIIYKNGNSGYNTGVPVDTFQYKMYGMFEVEDRELIENGCIYISVGSRGRQIANSPGMIVDLKAGLRFLRENADKLPGSTDYIISVADSGGGAASSLVGATGNMNEYLPYLYELGAAGVEWTAETAYDAADDAQKADPANYASTLRDDVYGCMMYCPIADLDNADLAYAWQYFDAGQTSLISWNQEIVLSDYELMLQDDLAKAFIDYVNGMQFVQPETGEALSLGAEGAELKESARTGSYYQAVLGEISSAMNKFMSVKGWQTWDTSGYFLPNVFPYTDIEDPIEFLTAAYGEFNEGTPDTWPWLTINEDGTYAVTDMASFINGTGLKRNKEVPGFDALGETAENNAFGDDNVYSVDAETGVVNVDEDGRHHYSRSVANVIERGKADAIDGEVDTYPEWLAEQWENPDPEVHTDWSEEFADPEFEALLQKQTWLYNALTMLHDYTLAAKNGTLDQMPTPNGPTIPSFWRSRNGTFDEHTAFTIGYNLYLGVSEFGKTFEQLIDYDYALVWGMSHGWVEGTTTGTFPAWVDRIVPKAD